MFLFFLINIYKLKKREIFLGAIDCYGVLKDTVRAVFVIVKRVSELSNKDGSRDRRFLL